MISLFSGVDLLERKKIKNIAMRGCAAIAVKLQNSNTGVKRFYQAKICSSF